MKNIPVTSYHRSEVMTAQLIRVVMYAYTVSYKNSLKIGLCSVLHPRQHSIGYMRDGFLQVKRPNQQYQSTEGTYSTQTNQTYNKQT